MTPLSGLQMALALAISLLLKLQLDGHQSIVSQMHLAHVSDTVINIWLRLSCRVLLLLDCILCMDLIESVRITTLSGSFKCRKNGDELRCVYFVSMILGPHTSTSENFCSSISFFVLMLYAPVNNFSVTLRCLSGLNQ